MKHREGTFQGAGGLALTYQSWHPGGFHEPHNDLDHDQVTQDLVDWLIERL